LARDRLHRQQRLLQRPPTTAPPNRNGLKSVSEFVRRHLKLRFDSAGA